MRTKTYPISEIFGPTIQGEGTLIGLPSMFLRLAGCDFDCAWCDTQFAINSAKPDWIKEDLTADQISQRLLTRSRSRIPLLTISGGNPALFVDLQLLDVLGKNYTLAIETQGTFGQDWGEWVTHEKLRTIVISPKPPSSGMAERLPKDQVQAVLATTRHTNQSVVLKYVVFDTVDLRWVDRTDRAWTVGTRTERVISIGTRPNDTVQDILERTRRITGEVLKYERLCQLFRVLPQLHALLWPHTRGK